MEWGGDEKGEVSLQVTWDQGGQGRITPREGFQVSKGEVSGNSKGSKKGGLRYNLYCELYMCT